MTYFFGNARPTQSRAADSKSVMLGISYKPIKQKAIREIRIWRNDKASMVYPVFVWIDGKQAYASSIASKPANGWNVHTLKQPIVIAANSEVVVGY